MLRLNDKIDSLFTPVMEGVLKDRFAYLITHRPGLSGKEVMNRVLGDLVLGEDEHILIMCGMGPYTASFRRDKKTEVILGSLTDRNVALEDWSSYMATVMANLKAAGTKVGVVILDGVIDEYVEALALTALNEKHDVPNPINAFYRQMRGLVCGIHELPLVVRHQLRHESILPDGIENYNWDSWYLGSRTLDQEFDATVLVYQNGDDYTAVRGKLRGGVYNTGEPKPRVKL